MLMNSGAVTGMLLDRDGIINTKAAPGEYITSPDKLVLISGASSAIRRVNELGIPVYVVTNQRWAAHYRDGIKRVGIIHQRLRALLGAMGARLDGIYTCVHEIDQCECRKPKRGMVDQILDDHCDLDLSSCVLVGDSKTDIELAMRCGIYSVRVLREQDNFDGPAADEVTTDLHSAILGHHGKLYC
jgi:D-glycero-D-manno-heptose 1,7-bisphosphate phosphatase